MLGTFLNLRVRKVHVYLILLDAATLASKMILSVDPPTNSREDDNTGCGVRRSALNPGSHLTAVDPSFHVPRNLTGRLWLQEDVWSVPPRVATTDVPPRRLPHLLRPPLQHVLLFLQPLSHAGFSQGPREGTGVKGLYPKSGKGCRCACSIISVFCLPC